MAAEAERDPDRPDPKPEPGGERKSAAGEDDMTTEEGVNEGARDAYAEGRPDAEREAG